MSAKSRRGFVKLGSVSPSNAASLSFDEADNDNDNNNSPSSAVKVKKGGEGNKDDKKAAPSSSSSSTTTSLPPSRTNISNSRSSSSTATNDNNNKNDSKKRPLDTTDSKPASSGENKSDTSSSGVRNTRRSSGAGQVVNYAEGGASLPTTSTRPSKRGKVDEFSSPSSDDAGGGSSGSGANDDDKKELEGKARGKNSGVKIGIGAKSSSNNNNNEYDNDSSRHSNNNNSSSSSQGKQVKGSKSKSNNATPMKTNNLSPSRNNVGNKSYYPNINYSLSTDLIAKCQDESISQRTLCLETLASIVEHEKTELKSAMDTVRHGDDYYSLICDALNQVVEMSQDAIPNEVEILPELNQEEKSIQESLKKNIENLKKYELELDRIIECSKAGIDTGLDLWDDGLPSSIIASVKKGGGGAVISAEANKASYLHVLNDMRSSCDKMRDSTKAAVETLERADNIQTSLYSSYKFFAGQRQNSKPAPTKKLIKDFQKLK